MLENECSQVRSWTRLMNKCPQLPQVGQLWSVCLRQSHRVSGRIETQLFTALVFSLTPCIGFFSSLTSLLPQSISQNHLSHYLLPCSISGSAFGGTQTKTVKQMASLKDSEDSKSHSGEKEAVITLLPRYNSVWKCCSYSSMELS